MLSERETALCSAVLALIGTDAMASMMQWPVPGHQRLDTLSDPAGCLAATSQPNPLVTLISIGVTPQSSPDTFLTQSVCLSVSAAAPRLERRIPSAVARHIHRQGSTCKVPRVSSCAQGWGRGHDGDTLASERNVFVSLPHAVSILLQAELLVLRLGGVELQQFSNLGSDGGVVMILQLQALARLFVGLDVVILLGSFCGHFQALLHKVHLDHVQSLVLLQRFPEESAIVGNIAADAFGLVAPGWVTPAAGAVNVVTVSMYATADELDLQNVRSAIGRQTFHLSSVRFHEESQRLRDAS